MSDILEFFALFFGALVGTMAGAVLVSFIRNGKKARGVFEEAMRIPGVAYVKMEAGTDKARDERIFETVEEHENDCKKSAEGS